MPYLFTSESVSEGHPDKMADQISDAIVKDIEFPLDQDTSLEISAKMAMHKFPLPSLDLHLCLSSF